MQQRYGLKRWQSASVWVTVNNVVELVREWVDSASIESGNGSRSKPKHTRNMNNTYALAILASLIPQDGPRFSVEDWNALVLATIAQLPESEHAFMRAQLIPIK
jgi:hypothetical protein